MSLTVCILITWSIIIIFALLPKKLSELEMIFLFFMNTIFQLTIFSLFNTNLRWIIVNHSVETSFADLILRLIGYPLIMILSSNFLLYSNTFIKWGVMVTIVLLGVVLQKVCEWLGIISTPHWNIIFTALLFCIYIAFSRLMTFLIVQAADRKGTIV